MRHGIAGIYGSRGNVESITCGDFHSLQNPDAATPTTYGNLVSFRVQRSANPEPTVATLMR